jgi:hypothetical protein
MGFVDRWHRLGCIDKKNTKNQKKNSRKSNERLGLIFAILGLDFLPHALLQPLKPLTWVYLCEFVSDNPNQTVNKIAT